MLQNFCEEIETFSNSIIIIDQYKQEYDEKGRLDNIINKCKIKKTIKFIISSSLNDNTVKEDFILNLKYLFKEKEKKVIIENKTDIEDILFKDFSLDNKIEDIKNPNKNFSKILIFNNNAPKIFSIEEKSQDIKIENSNSKAINEKTYPLYDITKIIYVNNLISLENIINKEEKKYFEIYDYNPKVFNKFYSFLSVNKYYLSENSYLKFLDKIYNDIENKVNEFYKNLRINNLMKESEENLKGTYIIKMIDIIKNKENIDFQTLI